VSILAPSIANLWKVIKSYGLDPAPLFAEQGLEYSLPIEPGTRASYHQVDRVRARAAELSRDPAFGLRAAEFFHPSQIGALGYSWLASSSLRTAFKRLNRYIRVINDRGQFDMDETDGMVTVTISVGQDSENSAVRDDLQMAILITLCRLNVGKDYVPRKVQMKREGPDDSQPWLDLFRCDIKFGAESNSMSFASQDVDRLLDSANPMLAQLNEQVVTRRLAQLDQNDIPNRVRAAIMEQLPSGGVSDESIADELHMTSRTLHRRLKQGGESFRGLLNEVRQDLAEQYISDPSLTLTEVTFLLGFAEASSFSRAYRRWTGSSPSAARQNVAED
jgi:AraC-like DNA-binding protein